MSDVKRIIDAIARLTAAIPGSRRSLGVSMHGCDGRALQALVAEGATMEHYTNEANTEEWDAAVLRLEGVTVVAYSLHRPLSSADTDTAEVEAALAQAAEVTP